MSKYHQFATLEFAARQCAKIGENLDELNQMLQQEESRLYQLEKRKENRTADGVQLFLREEISFSLLFGAGS
jgi:hypothetical protein